MKGDKPVTVPLATSARIEWSQARGTSRSSLDHRQGRSEWERAVQVGNETATLRVTGRIIGKSLVLDVTCCRPDIARFDPGGWGPTVRRKTVPVPYLSNQVDFLPAENLFAAVQLDWTASAATRHENNRALSTSPHRRDAQPLAERADFHRRLAPRTRCCRTSPNPPSPFLKDLADQVVLDIWGGSYETSPATSTSSPATASPTASRSSTTGSAAATTTPCPMHYPANAGYGGDAGMNILVATGTRLGIRVALHENYVDYYPNYEISTRTTSPSTPRATARTPGTTPAPTSSRSPSSPTPSCRWPPRSRPRSTAATAPTPITSTCTRPSRPGSTSISAPVKKGRASSAGLGHPPQLWAYERDTHAGPVFGEGNNHWYWSGCSMASRPSSAAAGPATADAPLAVDFDLLKIHPLQFNHGMGYYERWWAGSNRTNRPTDGACSTSTACRKRSSATRDSSGSHLSNTAAGLAGASSALAGHGALRHGQAGGNPLRADLDSGSTSRRRSAPGATFQRVSCPLRQRPDGHRQPGHRTADGGQKHLAAIRLDRGGSGRHSRARRSATASCPTSPRLDRERLRQRARRRRLGPLGPQAHPADGDGLRGNAAPVLPLLVSLAGPRPLCRTTTRRLSTSASRRPPTMRSRSSSSKTTARPSPPRSGKSVRTSSTDHSLCKCPPTCPMASTSGPSACTAPVMPGSGSRETTTARAGFGWERSSSVMAGDRSRSSRSRRKRPRHGLPTRTI